MLVRQEGRQGRPVPAHETPFPGPYFCGLRRFHGFFAGQPTAITAEEDQKLKELVQQIFGSRDPEAAFEFASKAIDLDVR